MTLSNLKVTAAAGNLSKSHTWENVARNNWDMFTQELSNLCGYNFNCHVEAKGHLNLRASHIHCKSGCISETTDH